MTLVLWINLANQTHVREFWDEAEAREVMNCLRLTGAAVSLWRWEPQELEALEQQKYGRMSWQ